MTKDPDWQGAMKAVQVVARQATPPFRYKIYDVRGQLIALTLTKWTGHLAAKALTNSGVGLTPFEVHDMDGNILEDEEEE